MLVCLISLKKQTSMSQMADRQCFTEGVRFIVQMLENHHEGEARCAKGGW
jgi:hypothetical protein